MKLTRQPVLITGASPARGAATAGDRRRGVEAVREDNRREIAALIERSGGRVALAWPEQLLLSGRR